MDDRFEKAEAEYFRMKGQLAAGRITREQFESALKDMMVQDAEGRWWMLGTDSAKWYVNDGTRWIESNPSTPLASNSSSSTKSSSRLSIIAVGLIVFIVLLVILVGGFFFASNQGIINISLGPTATRTINARATNDAQATALARVTPTSPSTPTPEATTTRTFTAIPTLTLTPTATPKPTGNCVDPGAQLSFQDGYRPDPYFHIMGSAKATNFQFYLVEFADRTDNPQWRQLRDPVTTQVDNAELALWALSTVGGHQWFVRVTVYLNDGTTLAPCVRWIQQR